VKTLRAKRQTGFNLVETIVASVILSAAVLAFGSIGTNAVVGTRINQHYKTAASLIDKQLTQIDFTGIDAFLESGETEGVVEELEPGYHWSVATDYQGTDNVYLVSVTVTWLEGKRPYEITAQTMLNGSSLVTASPAGGP